MVGVPKIPMAAGLVGKVSDALHQKCAFNNSSVQNNIKQYQQTVSANAEQYRKITTAAAEKYGLDNE